MYTPPGASRGHSLHVRNTSPLPLEFRWELRPAGHLARAGLADVGGDDGTDAYEHGFFVSPRTGRLPPATRHTCPEFSGAEMCDLGE